MSTEIVGDNADVVDQGTLEDGADSQVPVAEATDEELQGFLDAPDTEDSVEETSEVTPSPEAPTEPQPETGEKPTEPQQTAPQTPPTPVTQPTAEELQAQNERLKAQLAEKEKFIQRRSTEIGELRKQVRDYAARLDAAAEEAEAAGDIRKVTELSLKKQEAERKEEELRGEQTRLDNAAQAHALLPKYLSPEEFDPQAIGVELSEMNLPPAAVQQIVADPHSSMYPETLIFASRMAYYGKHLRSIVPKFQQLQQENAQLKEQLRNKPNEVLKGVTKALKTTQTVNATASASSRPNRTPVVNPANLSDADLEALLQGDGING